MRLNSDGWIQDDGKLWHWDKGEGIALALNNSAIRYIGSEDSSNGMLDRETDSFIIYGS